MKQRIVQLIATILTNAYVKGFLLGTIYQGRFKYLCSPGLNCHSCPAAAFACPIGVIQHAVAYGTFHIPFYAFGFLGMIGSVAGRMACGWACPFGFLQDLLFKVKLRKVEIPQWTSRIKYVVLIVLVFLIPYFTKEPWFSKLCPQGTLEAGLPLVSLNPDLRELLGGLFIFKVAILMAFLGWMMVTKRPFCRTTCPLGALYSYERNCIQCEQCYRDCPVSLKMYQGGTNSSECIRCLRCTKCPTKAVQFCR
jgi:polyferredoxin